jgi:hypothetical protein
MNFPSAEFEDAVAALCDGRIDDDALGKLHELLRADSAAQEDYLWRVELHSELASGELDLGRKQKANSRFPLYVIGLVGMLVLMASIWPSTQPRAVAVVTSLTDAKWMTPVGFLEGDGLGNEQRLELQSGTVDLVFGSGARMRLVGPTIVETLTINRARLVMGEAHVVAETAEAKGFTLLTPTSQFVDIGTAFTANVAPDGLSRLEVVEGEVDVVLDGIADSPRLRSGESLYVEPGPRRVITRLESGDGTAGFGFPTIGPPSREDFADQSRGHASVRVTQGQLRERPGPSASGPASVLLDGGGQSKQDSPLESAFFEHGFLGQFLVDLGQPISIETVNCYSWHQHNRELRHRHRATQRFTLYGFSGSEPPSLELPPKEAGWTRIARVNSDQQFRVSDALDRPAQQVSSISSAEGDLGRYRYLLWVVQRPTFFGEFDVFGSP